jgi:hypothetical protein
MPRDDSYAETNLNATMYLYFRLIRYAEICYNARDCQLLVYGTCSRTLFERGSMFGAYQENRELMGFGKHGSRTIGCFKESYGINLQLLSKEWNNRMIMTFRQRFNFAMDFLVYNSSIRLPSASSGRLHCTAWQSTRRHQRSQSNLNDDHSPQYGQETKSIYIRRHPDRHL